MTDISDRAYVLYCRNNKRFYNDDGGSQRLACAKLYPTIEQASEAAGATRAYCREDGLLYCPVGVGLSITENDFKEKEK